MCIPGGDGYFPMSYVAAKCKHCARPIKSTNGERWAHISPEHDLIPEACHVQTSNPRHAEPDDTCKAILASMPSSIGPNHGAVGEAYLRAYTTLKRERHKRRNLARKLEQLRNELATYREYDHEQKATGDNAPDVQG